jgi:hypothetical protein
MELRDRFVKHRRQLTFVPPPLDRRATPAPNVEFGRLLTSQDSGAAFGRDQHVS